MKPTTKQFVAALRSIRKPAPSILKMLKKHAISKNNISTARVLAKAAGYKDWRGFNLHYGKLARRIGAAMGIKSANICLLVEFVT